VDAGKVFHVAGKTVQSLNDDYVKRALTRFVHKCEQTITSEDGPARACAVIKNRDNIEAFALGVFSTKTDLIFYRSFILKIGREAGVDCSTFHLLGPCQRTHVHDLLAPLGERERAQDEESRYPVRLARPVFLIDLRQFAEDAD
jgi:hypothetical protein